MASKREHSVNFVCLGNICRSPMAEAIFRKLLEDRKCSDEWEVASSGLISLHVGEPPDPRCIKTLAAHGLSTNHKGRVVKKKDFQHFEYILCFDEENLSDLQRMQRGVASSATVRLLSSEGRVVDDPYYDEEEAFERTYQLCFAMCSAFLDSVYK